MFWRSDHLIYFSTINWELLNNEDFNSANIPAPGDIMLLHQKQKYRLLYSFFVKKIPENN